MTFQIVCGIFYTTFESFHPAGIASPFTTARTFFLVFCGHNLLEFLEKMVGMPFGPPWSLKITNGL
jgi:hypothetical protein